MLLARSPTQVLSVLTTECTVKRNLYSNLVFMTAAPVGVSLCIALWVLVKRQLAKDRKSRRDAFNKGSFAFLFLLFVIYPATAQVRQIATDLVLVARTDARLTHSALA